MLVFLGEWPLQGGDRKPEYINPPTLVEVLLEQLKYLVLEHNQTHADPRPGCRECERRNLVITTLMQPFAKKASA